MDKEKVGKELQSFARASFLKLLRTKGVAWKRNDIDLAIDELTLNGWEAYVETGDLGLAKHRIRSRRSNFFRQPKPKDGEERKKPIEHFIDELPPPKSFEEAKREPDRIDDFGWKDVDELDLPSYLTDRQKEIIRLRYVGLNSKDVARELRLNVKTIERELSAIRKIWKED